MQGVYLPSKVIVGLQWGDEGKGKIVDYLASSSDIVVRFNGGNNAGHTVVIAGKKYKLHSLPCGVLSSKRALIGAGVALDPKIVLSEIEEVKKSGITPNLGIDFKSHVITPYHRALDALQDNALGKKGAGSTKSGIAPVYSDKHARIGIRMEDLVEAKVLREKLKDAKQRAERISDSDIKDCSEEYCAYGRQLKAYCTDVATELNSAHDSGKSILFEAAQGFMLDIDHGAYPFCTSSNVIAGAVCTGAGFPPKKIGKVIGVAKAYTSRVGNGSFPSEITDETASNIREKGGEYGTTTGRPRRIGWLDLVNVKYACMINGVDELAVTKLDTLGGFQKIQVCTAYGHDGRKLPSFPQNTHIFLECKPIYTEFEGWGELKGITEYKNLPENCKKYLSFISKFCSVPISIASVGPGREETIPLTVTKL